MDILAVSESWSYWSEGPPPTVQRDVSLPTKLSPKVALVVQGVRRCGKSTLLAQMIDRYGLDRRRCLFLNFEDPRLANALTHTTLDEAVAAFSARWKTGPTYYFLDEIQLVDGWQRWVRTQLERPRDRHFILSGSNAQLLSGELGSSLTGRHLTIELYPFSLAEYRSVQPKASLETYLRAGGFPEPTGLPDADALLRQYFVDIIERDVRERVSARSSLPLRQLVQMVFESAGSELSLRRIAAALGVAVDTAGLYARAAEDAYLVFACPFFAWSQRQRLIRNAKYYPIDTGLRRVAITTGGADRGKMLECATYLALRKKFGAVSYWRGKHEVDFVVEDAGRAIPVQVTWDAPEPRHQLGLDEFYAAHPRGTGEPLFITAATFAAGL